MSECEYCQGHTHDEDTNAVRCDLCENQHSHQKDISVCSTCNKWCCVSCVTNHPDFKDYGEELLDYFGEEGWRCPDCIAEEAENVKEDD